MFTYAILQNPGHNRVYHDSAKKLSLKELTAFTMTRLQAAKDIRLQEIAGVPYFLFRSETELNETDCVALSRMSFVYALFQLVEKDGTIYFSPIQKNNSYYFSDDISMILKYSGKTNELFTRLMLNMAVMASDFQLDDELSIFDPICGKGTSLYEGLLLGYHCYGADIDEKAIHEANIFFKKYLETNRYKHSYKTERISGPNRSFRADKHWYELARTKQDQKTDKTLRFELVSGDSQYSDLYYKKNSCHVIIGDLPYGVQHSSKKEGGKGFTRNPAELVETCLPVWLKHLHPGGTVVLSWNNFVLKRDILAEVFEKNGLTVLNEEPFCDFVHRVDQAINRDIIIGKK